uniref:Uncharacterized protein n=1 Tax=Cyclophora tenuis TaxID=216820 RepID=A0A7S1GMB2_CYCTE|mmetsp:Transcript_22705/g.38623  ORF Transcript_22705/g.38623 Transcript_22705/m.38623 type:complete len:263 (+) Transcript_22705:93-881(+)
MPFSSIRVTAPSDLEGGSTFQTIAEGRPFVVTVPESGVKEGQQFEVPCPFIVSVDPLSISDSSNDDTTSSLGAPEGKWRNHLLSCFQVFCRARCWVACCCAPLQTAQLMTRLHLNWFGNEDDPESVRRTVPTVMLLVVVFLVLIDTFPYLTLLIFGLYFVFILAKARFAMRKRYRIGGQMWHNRVADCFLVLFCGCCASIQMTRHTHDEKDYPYDALAPNGLGLNAPELETKIVSPGIVPTTMISTPEHQSTTGPQNQLNIV